MILLSLLIYLAFLQHLTTTPGLSSGFPVPRPQSQGASVGSRWSAILWCPIRPVSAEAKGDIVSCYFLGAAAPGA
jgi:hypothetical protein